MEEALNHSTLRKEDHADVPNGARLAALQNHKEAANNPVPAKKSKVISLEEDILQAGYRARYERSDVIIDPIFTNLREWAGEWSSSKFKAPYTSIIGPTMIGKTQALMQLASDFCVVYICLRPDDSTGQYPSHLGLAEAINPLEADNLREHYRRLLGVIFETVAEFFLRHNVLKMKEKDTLQPFSQRLSSLFGFTSSKKGWICQKTQ
ncbi:hypothetical protein PCANC_13313 [Puccinia coronata f. sp. avenae]|uniref:Uncharacterized protein n=1 Tax=Puccinia coronata f. sp. avenae TaxID=200324 RepID=A0A2N5SZG4_9BASI|nr:hypothetical protein PCANC_13313 [Puccinia coronata f. sp. avenae]